MTTIAAAGNNVYVVWRDLGTNPKIRFKRSTNGGQLFGSAKSLYTEASDDESSFAPAVAAAGENVYVIWVYNAATPNHLMFC